MEDDPEVLREEAEWELSLVENELNNLTLEGDAPGEEEEDGQDQDGGPASTFSSSLTEAEVCSRLEEVVRSFIPVRGNSAHFEAYPITDEADSKTHSATMPAWSRAFRGVSTIFNASPTLRLKIVQNHSDQILVAKWIDCRCHQRRADHCCTARGNCDCLSDPHPLKTNIPHVLCAQELGKSWARVKCRIYKVFHTHPLYPCGG